MNPTRRVILAGVAGLSLIALSACGSDNGSTTKTTSTKKVACAKGQIAGAGSTFQQNIEQQWITDYGAQCAGAQINYQGTGSGAGIQQFGAGTIDFAGSDVTMKPDEQTKADATCGSKALHIPVTAGGIAIMYNVKGVSTLNLSAKTLSGIFQGTITKWNDPAIAADNPGSLPATPIAAYHRSDGSGTTSVFSGFLDANSGGDWKLGVGKQLNFKGGQAAKGSDGVTAGVKQTDGAITYVEVSFAKANNLPTAKVKGAGSDFVDLTGDNVGKFLAASFSVTGTGNDLSGKLDFKGVVGYPISTVSYVIVCEKGKNAAKATLVKDYVDYAVNDGQVAADKLGFAPLPAAIGDKVKATAKTLS
ncbi:MAG: phosphate ABC transporter substrate-binding protein PstS [Pseudonocardiales bacterium]|nr:MAG: phosphate ABC transporter substrate-binding protein PstS [Pseudonocardiales bacterium]